MGYAKNWEQDTDDADETPAAAAAAAGNAESKTLTRESPMPFGKHENKPMSSVPAAYLMWLWYDGLSAEDTLVAKYIRNNFEEIEAQYLKELPNIEIHFGKHKGTPLHSVPEDYLKWLYDKGFDKKFSPIRDYIEAHVI